MMDAAGQQQMLEPLFPGLMGIRLTEVTPERVVARMPVRADLCTAGGNLPAALAWPLPTPRVRWERWSILRRARRRQPPIRAPSSWREPRSAPS